MACAVVRAAASLSRWRATSVYALVPRTVLTLQSTVGVASSRQHLRLQSSLGGRQYTTSGGAGLQLLSCVKEEVGLEQALAERLPEVAGFTTTITGCLATLHRQHGNEIVKVELDTHHAVEVMPEELGEEVEEEEEEEPFFVPAFSVTVTNSSGSQLQMDCSFDEQGHYVEQGNEWDNLNVDAMSVVPADALSAESVYTASADNLSTDLHEGLLAYLQERGIGRQFATEIVQFYRVHEHRCYVEHSLKALQTFLQSS